MPPRATGPDAGHGRGGGGGYFRGGGGSGGSGGGFRGRGRGRGDRGAPRGGVDHGRGRGVVFSRGGGDRGRGRGVVLSRGGAPPAGGSASDTNILPRAHVQAIGVKRPGFGTAGRVIKVRSNHVEVNLDQGILYHYDVILPHDERRPMEKNRRIIEALQKQDEGRLAERPGVYDGNKNLFTSFDLDFETGACEYVVPPLGNPSQVEGRPPPQEFTVRLTQVAQINPEVLRGFVQGEQSHDNSVLTAITALNLVIRMEPSMRYPHDKRSFFTNDESRPIGGGIVLWRGYFQSVRPAINRMLINIDMSTGTMYKHGRLIDLCLNFLGKPGEPNALAPRHGFPDRERLRLSHFISGLKVITSYLSKDPDRRRRIKRLTRESAQERTFELADGETMSVMEYFEYVVNKHLEYPDLVCVELSTGAVIPLELCEVPEGQLSRKQMSPDQIRSILDFSTMVPPEREACIGRGLNVLRYGQSDYVRQFGMSISDNLVELDARIIKAPTLKYNPESRQPNVQPKNGAWNMIDKLMVKPAKIPNWMVIIYEGVQRFNDRTRDAMITSLVRGCGAVGITINPRPAVVRRESGQGNIGRQLLFACEECKRKTKAPPTLIVVILPEYGNDIYTAIKNFGDVSAGVATQCMKASKVFRARDQYFANITLKVNVKLGGTNVILAPQDVSFLTDLANPTIVMGGDITHPPPGSRDRPSFTSLVGSVDGNGARYVSTIRVQDSPREIIEDMEDMCLQIFRLYRESMGKLPKRILFYRDGVSEAEFEAILNEELPLIRKACEKLGFNPTITLLVVGKYHKVVFFPTNRNDAYNDNCLPGTVIDTDVVSPVEWDYYLCSHAGILGTSRPAHYNVLLDENGFTPDGIQSISYALCHVYARCTRSVSIPAPVYYAHNVCSRAKNHYDPQQGQHLFTSDIFTEDSNQRGAGTGGPESEFQRGFRQTHERMAKLMYFC